MEVRLSSYATIWVPSKLNLLKLFLKEHHDPRGRTLSKTQAEKRLALCPQQLWFFNWPWRSATQLRVYSEGSTVFSSVSWAEVTQCLVAGNLQGHAVFWPGWETGQEKGEHKAKTWDAGSTKGSCNEQLFYSFSFQECEESKLMRKWHEGRREGSVVLLLNLKTWVQTLGLTWWKDRTDSRKLSCDICLYMCAYTYHTHTIMYIKGVYVHTHYQMHNMHMIYIWIANGDSLDIKKSN